MSGDGRGRRQRDLIEPNIRCKRYLVKWSPACHAVEFWKKSHGKAEKTKLYITVSTTIDTNITLKYNRVITLMKRQRLNFQPSFPQM